MPKKAYAKKKRYQAKCREMVKSGKVNDPEGKWIDNSYKSAMEKDLVAGYNFK